MGSESDSESESQPPKKKKYAGAYKFKTQQKPEWFPGKYKGVIKPSQMDCYMNVSHQGFKDVDRHCEGRNHVDKLSSIRSQQSIQNFFIKKNSETDRLVSLAEVRFAGFLTEHNLPLAAQQII